MNNIKICCKCHQEKPIGEFYKDKYSKDGFRYECKSCCKLYNEPYKKQYRSKNIEKIKQQKRKHYIKNEDKISLYHKQWYIKNKERILLKRKQHYSEHKEKIKINVKQYNLKHIKEKKTRSRLWYCKNKKKVIIRQRKYINIRRKTDPQFRILCLLRARIKHVLKSQKVTKSLHTIELLGCTPKFFQNYIRSLFKPGMTLANDGQKKWHLHHIKCCHTFNLLELEQQKLCFHYTNMIPMWEDEHKALHSNYSN